MTRVVLLGASNVALAFPLIVRQLSAGLPGPLEIFGAFGHGRSYCTWSRVLFRGLPGIDRCGLWAELERATSAEAARTLALVTDIGNDLIYGSLPDVILARVEQCLASLASHGAEIVVTRIPLASVERLSALRFHATRTIFFPRTRASWPTMLERARVTDHSLAELATRYSARAIEQPLAWYGFDPIHIRIRQRATAWRTIFSAWPSFDINQPLARWSARENVRVRLAAPAERLLFGHRQLQSQPALVSNEVTLRLY